MLQVLIIFIEKNFFIKFHLPKFDLISQERLIFLVLGFAKYLQVSFLRLVTTVFVFFYLAVIFVLVLNLFHQQIHQLSAPLFQRLFLWLIQQFFFATFFTLFLSTLPIVMKVSRITPDPLCLCR